MCLILNIDTSTAEASVCLAKNGQPLAARTSSQQSDHAAWLHPAIKELLGESGYPVGKLDAVACVSGPGSYTGLRVAMASAKGFCYALHIPLITENTLYVMAFAASRIFENTGALLCPMLDARRQEVYTALYRGDLTELIAPVAMRLVSDSFAAYLEIQSVVFFGDGSPKFSKLVWNRSQAIFSTVVASAADLAPLSQRKFNDRQFTDLAYSEPTYLKDFYTRGHK